MVACVEDVCVVACHDAMVAFRRAGRAAVGMGERIGDISETVAAYLVVDALQAAGFCVILITDVGRNALLQVDYDVSGGSFDPNRLLIVRPRTCLGGDAAVNLDVVHWVKEYECWYACFDDDTFVGASQASIMWSLPPRLRQIADECDELLSAQFRVGCSFHNYNTAWKCRARRPDRDSRQIQTLGLDECIRSSGSSSLAEPSQNQRLSRGTARFGVVPKAPPAAMSNDVRLDQNVEVLRSETVVGDRGVDTSELRPAFVELRLPEGAFTGSLAAGLLRVRREQRTEVLVCIRCDDLDIDLFRSAAQHANSLLPEGDEFETRDGWGDHKDDAIKEALAESRCEAWTTSHYMLKMIHSGVYAGLRAVGLGSNLRKRQRAALLSLFVTAAWHDSREGNITGDLGILVEGIRGARKVLSAGRVVLSACGVVEPRASTSSADDEVLFF